MDEKIAKKPVKVVMVRRGDITTSNVPTQKLRTFIRKRVLLGTDEISSDGKNWIRVDRHYQLRNYFLNEDSLNDPVKTKSVFSAESEFSERPPDIENDLKEVVKLLKDINK